MAREAGSAFNEAFALLRLSEIHGAAGKSTEALDAAAQAVRVTETHRMPELHAESLLARGRLRADAAPRDARSDADAALAAALAAESKSHEGAARALLARLEAASGRTDAARAHLGRAADLLPACRVLHERLRYLEDEALARSALGEAEAAMRTLEAAVGQARERKARAAERRLDRVRGKMKLPV
jgi:tetratricopeptide (TPR) repeat protein